MSVRAGTCYVGPSRLYDDCDGRPATLGFLDSRKKEDRTGVGERERRRRESLGESLACVSSAPRWLAGGRFRFAGRRRRKKGSWRRPFALLREGCDVLVGGCPGEPKRLRTRYGITKILDKRENWSNRLAGRQTSEYFDTIGRSAK